MKNKTFKIVIGLSIFTFVLIFTLSFFLRSSAVNPNNIYISDVVVNDKEIVLKDVSFTGSAVWFSDYRYLFLDDTLIIEIDGRGLLKLPKDQNSPFSITIPNASQNLHKIHLVDSLEMPTEEVVWNITDNKPVNASAAGKIILEYVADLSDDKTLVDSADNIFVGKVLKRVGDESSFGTPSTQFVVKVIGNIKGDLIGEVVVDQLGGYQSGVLSLVRHDANINPNTGEISVEASSMALLIPQNTYLLTSRYDETTGRHILITHENSSKLLSSDASLGENALLELAESDEKVQAFREVYKGELVNEEKYYTGIYHASAVVNGLKSYTSEQYKLSLNYPATYVLFEKDIDSEPQAKYNYAVGSIVLGLELPVLESIKRSEAGHSGGAPSGIVLTFFLKTDLAMTLEQWLQSNPNGNFNPTLDPEVENTLTPVTIAGRPALKYHSEMGMYPADYVVFTFGDWFVQASSGNIEENNVSSDFETILSSIKF